MYVVKPDRYTAHTVLQPGVGQRTRNMGHEQHAGVSLEAPGGNEGQNESTQRQSIAIMGGEEFDGGNKLATNEMGWMKIGEQYWKC